MIYVHQFSNGMIGKAIHEGDHFEWTIYDDEGHPIPYSFLTMFDDGGEMCKWSDHCINHNREINKKTKN